MRADVPVCGTPLHPLAIGSHTRREENLPDGEFFIHYTIEESSGAAGIHIDVPLDLVLRLSDAYRGGEVTDDIDVLQRVLHLSAVAHIAADELCSWIEVGGRIAAMNLLLQGIEDSDSVPPFNERIGEKGTDESGSSRDENP